MTPTIEELLADLGWQVDVVIDDTSSILDTLLAGERAGHLVSVIATACVAQTERNAELEAAARAVVDAFPYTIDARWKPACNCAECIAMRALIALLSEETT